MSAAAFDRVGGYCPLTGWYSNSIRQVPYLNLTLWMDSVLPHLITDNGSYNYAMLASLAKCILDCTSSYVVLSDTSYTYLAVAHRTSCRYFFAFLARYS